MGWTRAQAGSDDAAFRRVLGVDPGTVVTGWGIVERVRREVRHVASGVVRPRGTRAERLAAIHAALRDICERFRPDAVSIEQTFVGDNVQSAFRLGEARGAVMVAAAAAGIPVAEYSPAQIKVAIVGSGRAAKTQVQSMVGRLLGTEQPLQADEADALGTAICHVHTRRFAACVGTRPGSKGSGVRGFKGRDKQRPSDPRTPGPLGPRNPRTLRSGRRSSLRPAGRR